MKSDALDLCAAFLLKSDGSWNRDFGNIPDFEIIESYDGFLLCLYPKKVAADAYVRVLCIIQRQAVHIKGKFPSFGNQQKVIGLIA